MPLAALSEILALAGLPPPAPERIAFTGTDPVFPTRFRIAASGAAAIAAAAMAAADLQELRSGRRPQAVALDLRRAAAALRSARYLRINGAPAKEVFDAVSGFYAVRDGRWVMLHCNFPNHRRAAMSVLGLPEGADRDAFAAAAASRDGLALEDAVHAASGCGAFVRSAAEWSRHPHAAAVAALPLLEVARIGDAPPEPLIDGGGRPLAGVRVLDLTRVLAGPTCARALAEHGADVLKVSGPHLPNSGEMEIDTGLGKLSTFLDLRRPDDAAQLRALIRDGRCDVFSQSYRPGALAARGFDAADIAALRPGIVHVELSAWGREGPWSGRRGFDTVVQSASGMAMIEGRGERPRFLPVSAIDYVSGYLMAFGAMVALARRSREGGSWRVRVSLARVGKWIVDRGLLEAAAIAEVPGELSAGELASMMTETESPLGLIRHLGPAARMSETPPRWARPPVPLGHDAPAWPPR